MVYVFQLERYHIIARRSVLLGFLGYTFFVVSLIVDLGIPDEWVAWFKAAVRPGTSTVVVLADDVDLVAFGREARRFAGAGLAL